MAPPLLPVAVALTGTLAPCPPLPLVVLVLTSSPLLLPDLLFLGLSRSLLLGIWLYGDGAEGGRRVADQRIVADALQSVPWPPGLWTG